MPEGGSTAIAVALIGGAVTLVVAFGKQARDQWMTLSIARRIAVAGFAGLAQGAIISTLARNSSDTSSNGLGAALAIGFTLLALTAFLMQWPPQSK